MTRKNFFYTLKVKNFIFIAHLILLSGCASNLKEYKWEKSFESNMGFNEALAKCEYDLQIMGKANDRLIGGILGVQSPIFEKCMGAQGYRWVKTSQN